MNLHNTLQCLIILQNTVLFFFNLTFFSLIQNLFDTSIIQYLIIKQVLTKNSAMNRSQAGMNTGDLFEKDPFNNHRKTNSNKDDIIEQFVEASDKCSSSSSQNQQKNTNVFDYANIGIFFPQKPQQTKASFDTSQTRSHSKKISNESNSNKDSLMKSCTNATNIDELYENTTILSHVEPKSFTKKKSNDYAQNKASVEEHLEAQSNYGSDSGFAKTHTKKKSSNSSKISHSKESSNEIDHCEISKKEIHEGEEVEKMDSNISKEKSFSTKPPKKGFNIGKVDEKLLESIMSKVNKTKPNNSGTTSYITQENSRTNNMSIFKNYKLEQEKAEKIDRLEKFEKFEKFVSEKSEKTEKVSDKSEKIEKFEDKKSRPISINQPVYGIFEKFYILLMPL